MKDIFKSIRIAITIMFVFMMFGGGMGLINDGHEALGFPIAIISALIMITFIVHKTRN